MYGRTKTLGYGFSEIVYKDAMEEEFISDSIPHQREAEMMVNYKGKTLRHRFVADFFCFEEIIIEVKSSDKGITDNHIAQTLNYLRVSGFSVGLLVNFGKRKLEYKRLVVSY